jgi:hypothetical protein
MPFGYVSFAAPWPCHVLASWPARNSAKVGTPGIARCCVAAVSARTLPAFTYSMTELSEMATSMRPPTSSCTAWMEFRNSNGTESLFATFLNNETATQGGVSIAVQPALIFPGGDLAAAMRAGIGCGARRWFRAPRGIHTEHAQLSSTPLNGSMTALGHEQTSPRVAAISALLPKAAMEADMIIGRDVPGADIARLVLHIHFWLYATCPAGGQRAVLQSCADAVCQSNA